MVDTTIDGIACRNIDFESMRTIEAITDYSGRSVLSRYTTGMASEGTYVKIAERSINLERLQTAAENEPARIQAMFAAAPVLESIFPKDLGVVFEPARKYLITDFTLPDPNQQRMLAETLNDLMAVGAINGCPLEYRDSLQRDFAISHIDEKKLVAIANRDPNAPPLGLARAFFAGLGRDYT